MSTVLFGFAFCLATLGPRPTTWRHRSSIWRHWFTLLLQKDHALSEKPGYVAMALIFILFGAGRAGRQYEPVGAPLHDHVRRHEGRLADWWICLPWRSHVPRDRLVNKNNILASESRKISRFWLLNFKEHPGSYVNPFMDPSADITE